MKDKIVRLKDRLNDLSKRNRSIRMLRIYDKWAFDISAIRKVDKNPQTIVESVISNQNKITLVKQDVHNDESLILSRKLTTLYRNIKSIEEETGLYDLYIGYPYISGCALDGTYLRAPLFLYPVKLERTKTHGVQWELHSVEDGEPQLNRTFFLAMKKLSNLYVPETMYEEAEEQAKEVNFLKWLTWLKDNALNINWIDQSGIQPFVNYKSDEVPDLKKGEFQIDNTAVLAHFPQGNSALIKDYEDFITGLESNQMDMGKVKEFLNVGETNNRLSVDNLQTTGMQKAKSIKTERERFFVLDTDASQEEIIESLYDQEGLVIHGPPGTGKSQVIVNIIADSIVQNKKVLLVCQKRAALDVVYQRLESLRLSSFIGLLHDEKNDRKSLYRKINTRVSVDAYPKDIEEEFEQLSSKIEKNESELDAIANALYEVQPFGYRAYDLYGLGKPVTTQEIILNLQKELEEINKNNLDDVLATIFSYGKYYSRFGAGNHPLKNRKTFAKLEIKDRLTMVEVLKTVIEKAKESIEFLDHFDQDDVTPEYSLLVSNKLEKIYDDLKPEEKRTLQKLRLWWWTSFTGKTIIEELLDGDKFKGLSSKEWPKLRESLRILYELAKVSENMSDGIKQLIPYFSDASLNETSERISKGDIPLADLEKQQEYVVQDFEDLRSMDRTYDESLAFVKSIINQLKEKYKDNIHKDLEKAWVETAKQSIYIYWIDEIERKYPDLGKIGSDEFNKLRSNFRELLLKKKELSARVLQNRLLKKLMELKQSKSRVLNDIAYQTGKKRQIWPVRMLIKQYSLDGLLDVMPVWLVSPETASAIFPLEKNLFDLVVFDEASQCTVENGIPAVYRGNKIVIAGDEKQLPPSNLFKGEMDSDDEDELNELEESESLLNLAKRIYPNKMLQWHYRSKSEELINFSNHAYYNGNVQIAPNVEHLKEPAAIQWHKVDGRWINQCNEVEAKEVVDLLKKLLINDSSKSIGIITFNAKQQDKIQDMIELKAEDDTEFNVIYQQVMSRDMDERIFVKNIENVQGDERDIIIFSIAYAKGENGRVYNRFGTLGQQGGENRLNVAVTRAKEEIHLVTSIDPHELDVSNTMHDGPKFLKSYMEYAKAVSDVKKDTITDVLSTLNEEINTKTQEKGLHFDSTFEEQVYEQLINIGYKVDTQVGMSGYRIDLAVIHPNNEGKYILGIECDGAMYHSAPSAKERDVYRQRFLESKGWKIARIWSRNWWKDPISEIEKIDQLIKDMVDKEKIKEVIR